VELFTPITRGPEKLRWVLWELDCIAVVLVENVIMVEVVKSRVLPNTTSKTTTTNITNQTDQKV
jgi:hypothetical protein